MLLYLTKLGSWFDIEQPLNMKNSVRWQTAGEEQEGKGDAVVSKATQKLNLT